MYKLIQKNQKKFLAIFGVLLMVVFILPTNTKNNLGRSGDSVVGAFGGDKLYGRDVAQAKYDVELLTHSEFYPLYALGDGYALTQFKLHDDLYAMLQKEAERQGVSVTAAEARSVVVNGIAGETLSALGQQRVDDELVPAVRRFLLVQSAYDRAEGAVKVSNPLLNYLLVQDTQEMAVNLIEFKGDDNAVAAPPPTPEQIRVQYDKYADSLPVPENFFSGTPAQPGYKVPDRVKLQYLELPHDAVVRSVVNGLSGNDPYALGMDAYEYYKNHLSDPAFRSAPTTEPAAILSTQPSTGPSTSAITTTPGTNPTTSPAAPTSRAGTPPPAAPAPTTKPFEQVQADLAVRLVSDVSIPGSDLVKSIREQVKTKQLALAKAMHDELAAAYKDWSAAHPDGQVPPEAPEAAGSAVPTTGPTTLPVESYPVIGFFQQFAEQFQIAHGVRPLVTTLSRDWLTRDELNNLSPLSGASTAAGERFPTYAIPTVAAPPATGPSTNPVLPPTTVPTTATAATPATTPSTAPVAAATTAPATRPIVSGLHVLEPSAVLTGGDDAFVFRLLGFEPAHKPSLDEATAQIVRELKSAEGLKKAREDAAASLALLDKHGFSSAAKAFGHPVLQAGPFASRLAAADLSGFGAFQLLSQPLRGYDPGEGQIGDKIAYLKGIQSLLQKVTLANPHPSALIELPAGRRVLVAQVVNTVLPWTPDQTYGTELRAAHLAMDSLAAGENDLTNRVSQRRPEPSPTSLVVGWFNYDKAVSRLHYVSSRGKE